MSLGRLLATGKSLVGMKDTNSPYRMSSQNLLPKFGGPKNPFCEAPAQSATPAEAEVEAAGTEAVESPREISVTEEPSTATAPVEVPVVVAKEPEPARPSAQVESETMKERTTEFSLESLEASNLFETFPAATAPVQPAEEVKPSPVNPPSLELPVAQAAPVSRERRAPLSAWLKKMNPLKAFARKNAKPASGAKRGRGERVPVQAELKLDNVKVIRNDLSDSDLKIVSTEPAAAPACKPVKEPAEPEVLARWGKIATRMAGAEQMQSH